MSKPVVVVGAGPAGMTTAFRLTQGNVPVRLLESSDRVGGMATTITLWDQKVDLGPHRFFSQDPRVNALFHEVVKEDFVRVQRTTRIFYSGKYFKYPLQAWDALSQLGVGEAVRCVLSYAWGRIFPGELDESTFEGWVVRRFGRRLF